MRSPSENYIKDQGTKRMHRQLCLFAIATTIAFFLPTQSNAQDASALIKTKVSLVQCGQTRADLPRACREDQRCCAFLDDQPNIIIAAAEPRWQEGGYNGNDNNPTHYYTPVSKYSH